MRRKAWKEILSICKIDKIKKLPKVIYTNRYSEKVRIIFSHPDKDINMVLYFLRNRNVGHKINDNYFNSLSINCREYFIFNLFSSFFIILTFYEDKCIISILKIFNNSVINLYTTYNEFTNSVITNENLPLILRQYLKKHYQECLDLINSYKLLKDISEVEK